MFSEIRKIFVFIVRDFRMLSTYKLAFSVSVVNVIFSLFYMVLFGSMFGVTNLMPLAEYGGNYIAYILIGSIGWAFLWTIMETTSASLSTEMMMGPLESVLLTKTRLSTMMISYALFGAIFGIVSMVIFIVVGFALYGLSLFGNASIFTFVIFALSTAMMMGFGMIFGGLTLWLKNIGETVPLLKNIVMFFCGVYFPASVLPGVIQPVKYFIPFYYSIEGLRRSLLPSTSFSDMMFYVVVLLILAVVFVLLGVYVLHRCMIKAKRDGSLAFY